MNSNAGRLTARRTVNVCFVLCISLVAAGCSSSGGSGSPPPPVRVATPTFSPAGGTYTSAQNVTLADTTVGAAIRYTTDGSTPTGTSTLYVSPIAVSASETITAIATATGDAQSAAGAAAYVVNLAVTPAPSISPAGGSFLAGQTVTLSDTAAGAAIYYTVDGTTPTTASAKYATPFGVASEGATTVEAIAVASGTSASTVTSATFTLTLADYQPTYTYKSVAIVGGGFVDGIYFHPKQQGLMYAHTDVGGAYRWNNVAGGDTQWVALNDFTGRFSDGFNLGVAALAVDPNDATRLYLAVGEYIQNYGGGNGAIEISSDMGKTFTVVTLPFRNGSNDDGRQDGPRLVVDPNNGKHLYFGTVENGLWDSADRGQTWAQVTAFPIQGLSSNPEDPEVQGGVVFEVPVAASGTAGNGNTKQVYYGVSSPTVGLYVTNDGGATFSAVPGEPTGYYPNATSLDAKSGILYVSYGLNNTPGCSPNCDNSGPYGPNSGEVWAYQLPTSGNANGTWTNITPPQTTPSGGAYGWGSVVVDPSSPHVVMVTTLNKYYPFPEDDVFRSVDSGATWVNIGTNVVRDPTLSPWVLFGDASAGPGNWLNHLSIDPFDSDHVLYGDGQTIWQTIDMTDADGVATSPTVTNHAKATHWSIGALGIEETVVTALVSPPSGPAHLISQVGDLGGFTHTDLTVSPASQMQMNPQFSTGSSVDFAQASPLVMARVGTGNLLVNGASGIGGYSADGGLTWTPFANNPPGVTSQGGTIAVAADGSTMVWMPSQAGVSAYYSTDHGTTWVAATSAAQTQYGQIYVYADRVNAKKFYLFDASGDNGQAPFYVSTDGAHTFTLAATISTYGGTVSVSPKAEGDVWFGNYGGLYHSTNSAAAFTQVAGVPSVFGIGFGAAAPGGTYPAIYMVGQVASDAGCTYATATAEQSLTQCVYRSIDGGTTFVRINDVAHQYGQWGLITGDPRVYGRVFFGTPGRGIIEGDSAN